MKIKSKRQRGGRKCRALPRGKAGADQKYKEFNLVMYYDEPKKHWVVQGTNGNFEEAGRIMRRLAGWIDLTTASAKVGNVERALWNRLTGGGAEPALGRIGAGFLPLGGECAQSATGADSGHEGPCPA